MKIKKLFTGAVDVIKGQAVALAAGYVDGKIDTPEERKAMAHKIATEHIDEIEEGIEWLLEQVHNVADKFDGD